MIFTKEHCDKIMRGEKTQTLRRADKRCPKVGDEIAVQPGRGKFAVGHVRVTVVEENMFLYDLSPKQIKADGLKDYAELWNTLARLNRCDPDNYAWNRIEFEVVKDA